MRTEHGIGIFGRSWNSIPASIPHLPDLEAVCWFAVLGLSLTALICALGYADSICQALAASG